MVASVISIKKNVRVSRSFFRGSYFLHIVNESIRWSVKLRVISYFSVVSVLM